jgi:hypothetical protein
MKSLNDVRQVKLKYPRETPRISRKKLWYDRSEWRQNDPSMINEGSGQIIDDAMHGLRNTPDLQQSKLEGLTGAMNVAARVGLKKL